MAGVAKNFVGFEKARNEVCGACHGRYEGAILNDGTEICRNCQSAFWWMQWPVGEYASRVNRMNDLSPEGLPFGKNGKFLKPMSDKERQKALASFVRRLEELETVKWLPGDIREALGEMFRKARAGESDDVDQQALKNEMTRVLGERHIKRGKGGTRRAEEPPPIAQIVHYSSLLTKQAVSHTVYESQKNPPKSMNKVRVGNKSKHASHKSGVTRSAAALAGFKPGQIE